VCVFAADLALRFFALSRSFILAALSLAEAPRARLTAFAWRRVERSDRDDPRDPHRDDGNGNREEDREDRGHDDSNDRSSGRDNEEIWREAEENEYQGYSGEPFFASYLPSFLLSSIARGASPRELSVLTHINSQ
jgi:hypothetical protein